MEKSTEHICHSLLYEYQLGHIAREATRNICQAIGEGSMSPTTAWRWFERFRNNDFSLEDEQKSGRPTEINLDELKQVIESDPSLTTRTAASKVRCSQSAVVYHFKQFQLWDPHDVSHRLPQNPACTPKNIFFMFGEVYVALFIGSCFQRIPH